MSLFPLFFPPFLASPFSCICRGPLRKEMRPSSRCCSTRAPASSRRVWKGTSDCKRARELLLRDMASRWDVYLDFQIWNADSRESGNWTRHKVYPIILALFLVIWRVSFASNSTVFIWKWGISRHLSFSTLLHLWYHASPQLPPNISIHGYVFRN